MKRLLFGALAAAGATAALAAPSSAQANTAAAIPPPCNVGEAYVECAERHANAAVDTAIYLLFYYDPVIVPPVVRKVEEVCERSLSNCPL
jgi:hypothetical protein